jgi:hypothetical protein
MKRRFSFVLSAPLGGSGSARLRRDEGGVTERRALRPLWGTNGGIWGFKGLNGEGWTSRITRAGRLFMRSILLMFLGIPLPIILLLALCTHHF